MEYPNHSNQKKQRTIQPRALEQELALAAATYPVVGVLGPRQSGKTTLARKTFPQATYVLLEEPSQREFALSDPLGFLNFYQNEAGLILDEVQHAPELFSYIQGIVDREQQPGQFLLIGSQNFVLNEKISQTLAGRIRLLTLLPPSIAELKQTTGLPSDYETLLWSGSYPRIHFDHLDPARWYEDYITTYLERDVRQLKAIVDLYAFQQFLALCAGRIGQLLNLSELARDGGITVKTARSWLSILQASYVLFFLPSYHNNFGKRVVKSPKLYFYDTGVASSLLKLRSPEQHHYLKGALFESLIVSDLYKQYYHQGKRPTLYFWRDKQGLEIDCLIKETIPLEIKSGRTLNRDFFSSLQKWKQLAQAEQAYLIYGGHERQTRTHGEAIGWQDLDLFNEREGSPAS